MTCTTCGQQSEQLITNVQKWKLECQRCCMGEDRMMLRRVCIRTTDGHEVKCVYAPNNLVAANEVAKGRNILGLVVTPLPN